MAKNGFSMSNRVAVETLTASKTLTDADCGKVFVIQSYAADGVVTVTLPAPADAGDGWNCEFVFVSSSSPTVVNRNVVISSSAGTVNGAFSLQGLRQVPPTTLYSDTLNAVTHSDDGQLTGDVIKILNVNKGSDGIVWSTEAITSASLT